MKLTDLIEHPTFEVTLPITKSVVKYRPWTVKEEKKLLIAKESSDVIDKLNAITEIVALCSDTPNDLPVVDTEFLFYNIRIQSVGPTIPLIFDRQYDAVADLNKLKVVFPEGHTNRFKLSEKLGITMKYPTYETAKKIIQKQESNEDIITFEIIQDCIDYIETPSKRFKFSEYDAIEQEEFFDSLNHEAVDKIAEFFQTAPYILLTINYDTPEGAKEYEVKSLANFFS